MFRCVSVGLKEGRRRRYGPGDESAKDRGGILYLQCAVGEYRACNAGACPEPEVASGDYYAVNRPVEFCVFVQEQHARSPCKAMASGRNAQQHRIEGGREGPTGQQQHDLRLSRGIRRLEVSRQQRRQQQHGGVRAADGRGRFGGSGPKQVQVAGKAPEGGRCAQPVSGGAMENHHVEAWRQLLRAVGPEPGRFGESCLSGEAQAQQVSGGGSHAAFGHGQVQRTQYNALNEYERGEGRGERSA